MRFTSLESLVITTAGETIALLQPIGGALKPIADQGIRAAGSAMLQTVEGLGRRGRDRANKLTGGYAESKETMAVLTFFVAAKQVDAAAAETLLQRYDSVCARLWRITHPR